MIRNSSKVGLIIAALICFFPWVLKRLIYKVVFGYSIQKGARIGISIICVDNLYLGENARIGHFNICKGLKDMVVEEYGSIGHMNWISCQSELKMCFSGVDDKVCRVLRIGKHSAITMRHYIDCSGGVDMGEYSILAGIRTQILTHGIDFISSRQRALPVVIGSYCFIGSGSILLAGAAIPERCILAAGSVLNIKFEEELCLYAGVPAKKKKSLSSDYVFFNRKVGYVE